MNFMIMSMYILLINIYLNEFIFIGLFFFKFFFFKSDIKYNNNNEQQSFKKKFINKLKKTEGKKTTSCKLTIVIKLLFLMINRKPNLDPKTRSKWAFAPFVETI